MRTIFETPGYRIDSDGSVFFLFEDAVYGNLCPTVESPCFRTIWKFMQSQKRTNERTAAQVRAAIPELEKRREHPDA